MAGTFERAGCEGADGFIVLDDQKLCHGRQFGREKLTFPESTQPLTGLFFRRR
ncbi:msr3518 [Mesorhizobium japonicum MAFF 303099]|uniref:Msr3518 protein n=1 Tax=Mesorhizobium japonicum (strain LMG 29417 / CECT 9101 / MAFF 303099) TaxID=266835 RepID=Q98G26_RHILO|nr:msr3518 [Mesorhizobium japonicum MAFF 303099]